MYPYMISVKERAKERAKTLKQLPFTPDVIMPVMPPSPESNCEQGMRGLSNAVKRRQAALMLEDDIDVNSFTFKKWLELSQAQPNPVTLCLLSRECIHPRVNRAIQRCERAPAELFEVQNLHKWFGSQCLYIPLALAERVVTDGIPSEHPYGFDILFKRRLLEYGVSLLQCSSDPVWHRGAQTIVNKNRTPHKSVTFGLAVDWL